MRSLLLSAVLAGLLLVHYTAAICNKCENGHACISKNEYQLCFRGVRDTSATYNCSNPNEICTKFNFICKDPAEAVNLEPACGDLSQCAKCDGLADGLYTCTSRTTYTMCYKGNLTDIRATCPENLLCDVAGAAEGRPCVSKCNAATAVLCDTSERIDEPPVVVVPTTTPTPTTTPETSTNETTIVDTTIEPATTPADNSATNTTTTVISPTPDTTQNSANAVCAASGVGGVYPFINDTTCRNFVYCFWSGGSLQGIQRSCPSSLYFNAKSGGCEAAKPAGCL